MTLVESTFIGRFKGPDFIYDIVRNNDCSRGGERDLLFKILKNFMWSIKIDIFEDADFVELANELASGGKRDNAQNFEKFHVRYQSICFQVF